MKTITKIIWKHQIKKLNWSKLFLSSVRLSNIPSLSKVYNVRNYQSDSFINNSNNSNNVIDDSQMDIKDDLKINITLLELKIIKI